MVAGCFLLLGAILSYVFTNLNERRKEQRKHGKKWHDELRHESAQLVSLVHQLDLEAPELNEAREEMKDSRDLEVIEGYLKLSEKAVGVMTEVFLLNSTIKIIAPAEVAASSSKLVDAAGEVMSRYSSEASAVLGAEMTEFLKHVRAALGIEQAEASEEKFKLGRWR